MYLDCLDKRKIVLGDTHPDTLTSLNNLAILYYKAGLNGAQGRYEKAEPLYLECLDKRKAVLGETHPDTLTTQKNLAKL